MALVDYERAWLELSKVIASKPHHGSASLHAEMARIAAECALPERELSKVLRLYGVEVEHDFRRDHPLDAVTDSLGGDMAGAPTHRPTRSEEDHDGRANRSRVAGAV